MTPVALALSLAPPRAPPFDSAQRALLLGKDPSLAPLIHHGQNAPTMKQQQRALQILKRAHSNCPQRLPHPHLPSKTDQQSTRFLGTLIPRKGLHYLRDSGGFRAIVDGIVTATIPSLAIVKPSAAIRSSSGETATSPFSWVQSVPNAFLPFEARPSVAYVLSLFGDLFATQRDALRSALDSTVTAQSLP